MGLTDGTGHIVLDRYGDDVGWAERLVPSGNKRGSPQTETSAQAGWDLMSSRSWASVTSKPSLLVVAMAMNLRHVVGGLFRIWMESVESEEDGADGMG